MQLPDDITLQMLAVTKGERDWVEVIKDGKRVRVKSSMLTVNGKKLEIKEPEDGNE